MYSRKTRALEWVVKRLGLWQPYTTALGFPDPSGVPEDREVILGVPFRRRVVIAWQVFKERYIDAPNPRRFLSRDVLSYRALHCPCHLPDDYRRGAFGAEETMEVVVDPKLAAAIAAWHEHRISTDGFRAFFEAAQATAVSVDELVAAFQLTDEERQVLMRFLTSFQQASEAGEKAKQALGINEKRRFNFDP